MITIKKFFICGCGWLRHGLCVEHDAEDGGLWITVINAPTDNNLWQRIRGAVKVLRGDEHILSEVVINPDDIPYLVSAITAALSNTETASANNAIVSINLDGPK